MIRPRKWTPCCSYPPGLYWTSTTRPYAQPSGDGPRRCPVPFPTPVAAVGGRADTVGHTITIRAAASSTAPAAGSHRLDCHSRVMVLVSSTDEESLKEGFTYGPLPLDRLTGPVKRGEEDRAIVDRTGGPGHRAPAGRFAGRGARSAPALGASPVDVPSHPAQSVCPRVARSPVHPRPAVVRSALDELPAGPAVCRPQGVAHRGADPGFPRRPRGRWAQPGFHDPLGRFGGRGGSSLRPHREGGMGRWGRAAHDRTQRPVRTGLLRLRGNVGPSDRPTGYPGLPPGPGGRTGRARTDDLASEVGGPLPARPGRLAVDPDRPRNSGGLVRAPLLGPTAPRAWLDFPPLDSFSFLGASVPGTDGEPDLLCRGDSPFGGAPRTALPGAGGPVPGLSVPIHRPQGSLADWGGRGRS